MKKTPLILSLCMLCCLGLSSVTQAKPSKSSACPRQHCDDYKTEASCKNACAHPQRGTTAFCYWAKLGKKCRQDV